MGADHRHPHRSLIEVTEEVFRLLTQCPNCRTIYQLGASDLSAARGYVECGECDTQFNALERLADEPAFAPAAPAADQPASASAVAEGGPAFVLLDPVVPESTPSTQADPAQYAEATLTDVAPDTLDEPEMFEVDRADSGPDAAAELLEFDPDPDPVATNTAAADPADRSRGGESAPVEFTSLDTGPADSLPPEAAELGPIDLSSTASLTGAGDEDTASAESLPEDAVLAGMAPLRPATTELDESDHAILFTEPDAAAIDAEPDDITEPFQPDDVPEVIKDEVAALAEPPRRRFRWFWVLLAIGLTVFLALQFALTLRTQITAHAPELGPLFAVACDTLGCPAVVAEPTAIELLSRDVRDHPQYRDTLLVNATLVSRADAPVPFPVLQLGLQGPTGDLLGIRRFEPGEYLDKSIDIAGGMPPNRTVYIVLEVAQVGARAVSFEFDFL